MNPKIGGLHRKEKYMGVMKLNQTQFLNGTIHKGHKTHENTNIQIR